MKKILCTCIILLLFLTLTGCKNKNEIEDLKQKTDASIKYLDSSLVVLLNQLNNISFESYYVTTEKIKLEDQAKNSSKSSQSSENNKQGENSESSGSEGGNEGATITVSDMKSKNILSGDRNNIDWNNIKAEIENLYSSWNSIIIDLYKLGINNENILQFSTLLDEVLENCKKEKKEEVLISVSNLYSLIPAFIQSYSNDNTKVNLKLIKSYVIKAYANVASKDWIAVASEIGNAETSCNIIMQDSNFVSEKTYNINKMYVTLKELQNSIALQDEDIFYIKYKNFMEEINLL